MIDRILGKLILSVSLLLTINSSAFAVEVLGEVIGTNGDEIYVQFPDGVSPQNNQVLPVIWMPDGSRIDTGKIQVKSVEDSFVTGELIEGQASIGMSVAFESNNAPSRPKPQISKTPRPAPAPAPGPNTASSEEPYNDDEENVDESLLGIDTTWAMSLVNAEDWNTQTLIAKSTAMSRYSRALLSERGKNERAHNNAARLYKRAAEKGHRAAQFKLGWMFENGIGVERNVKLALAWYQIAASKGHRKAGFGVTRMEAVRQ